MEEDIKLLTGERAAFLKGFECAVDEILNLEGNLDVYSTESLLMHFLDENKERASELFNCIRDWVELTKPQVVDVLIYKEANND